MVFSHRDVLSELEADEKLRVRSEQVTIAYKQARASIVPLLLGAVVIVYFFSWTPAAEKVAVWFGAVMATLAWRVTVLKYSGRLDERSRERRFALMMYASALTWGMSALFIFETSNHLYQIILIFMLAGIAAVASGTIASLITVAVPFLVLLLLPMALMLLGAEEAEYRFMGVLTIAFFFLLYSATKRISKNIVDTLIIKILHEKAIEALALSEEHFGTLFKEAPAGIFHYGSDLVVVDSNDEMLQILQIPRERMIGLDMKMLPDTCLHEALGAPLRGEKGYYEGPYKTMTRQLSLHITLRTAPVYDAKRNVAGGVGIVTDISDRVRNEEQMKHQAYHDALTGLPNRILLKDRIEQALAHYHRYGSKIAVMFLDLDHFKSVNDSLGHQVGDRMLVETAQRLMQVCQEEDTVARLGGDEFIILLNHLGRDGNKAAAKAEAVAEKIHRILSEPYDLGLADTIVTSSSIGVAVVSSEEQNADDLLKHADNAMYQAKKEGRNTTRFYLEKMDEWIKKRLYLENTLRSAIRNGELELHYQPVIEVATKRIIGAEALVRWNHPEIGMVMPDEMIGIAEESGLIIGIGEWVLRKACTDFVRWRASRPSECQLERIAVNVSAVQFRQSDFVDKVIRIVAETNIVPSMLELELTESMIIDKFDTIIQKMERLRTAGIGISMDDFGTGYSSLAYLKRLPFTTLKIDRSFIRDIMIDRDDATLVETILSMASIFKLDVIAEGVETVEQFRFLESHGCQYFQGYLCSRPVPAKRFEEVLNAPFHDCTLHG